MQIDFERGLTSSWVAFSHIVTPDSNETYLLQNRGPDVLLLYKSDTEPSEDSLDGVLIEPYSYAKYSADAELYLRAFHNNCSINISTVEGQGGGGGSANIKAITVMPSTSAQTITASGGVDGYSPITVSAVTSSIDANIVAGNIKKDVEILGVTGTFEGGGQDTVEAYNNTGSAISAGDKVWLEKVSGAWNVISFYGDLENFNRIGSPTITNKVVSGFSSSNYLRLLQGFNPENNTWEVGGLRFNIQTPNIWQGLFGSNVSNSSFGVILHFDSSNKFLLSLSTNGSSWVHIYGSVAQINTDYWAKFGWTGTEYYLDISTDGSTYTRVASESISSPIVSNLTQTYIGANMEIGGVGNPFGGSINLSEMYIKIGNSIWWTPYYTNILTDALTGTAAENIAVGASGDVNTVLPNS